MQNKGLVKFFAILFALVSIYQLSFTFVANKVKSDAKAFAGGHGQHCGAAGDGSARGRHAAVVAGLRPRGREHCV